MADAARLRHLQRPLYQAAEPEVLTPQTPSNPRPAVPREQKIVPESLPRPLSRNDENLGLFTANGILPPSPDSVFYVKEQGVSNPRLLRLSLNCIPVESSVCSGLGLPLGAIWHPLAETQVDDDPILTVETPPFRCSRCFAYINSFFKFIDSGRKCVCNICGLSQDTPELYMRDRATRPELYAGTYDFKAPAEYSNRPVQVPLFLFCIDTSSPALQLGIVQQVLVSIRAILDYLPNPDRTLIGVLTFDSSVQIFKVSNNGELSEVLMTDIDDPFIPEPVSGCCYNAGKDRAKLESLLEKLSEWNFSNPSKQSLSIGALAHAFKEHMLKGRGGRVIIFTSQLGTLGKHGLVARPEMKPNHAEKEKMYLPADNYLNLAQECCAEDICIDIFACTHQSVNVPNLAILCSQTGGDFYYFPAYKTENDGEKIYYLLARILTRPSCSQVVMRARCSNGLSVDYYIGKYKRKGPVEMEIACLDSDKSVAVLLKYDEKLTEGVDYYIQCAMLYTSQLGERLIRICNSKVFANRSIPNIFKSADVDAIANIMLRVSANSIFEQSLSTIRENWHNATIKMLIGYRQSMGDSDPLKILVPEGLRNLPLYCNTALKLQGLTLCGVSLDLRLASIHSILGMTVLQSRFKLYPKVYSVHDLMSQTHSPGMISNESLVILPNLVGCSREFLKSEGIYLISNGEILMFFIGKETNYEILRNVWGLDSAQELFENPEYWPLRDLETEESQRLLAIIEEIRKRNSGAYTPILYYFEGFTTDDGVLKKLIVEDNNSAELGYGDFLMRLHKVVLNKISRKD